MTPTEAKRLRSAIWSSLRGCECPSVIDGKPTRADERCTAHWVRCNGRLKRIHAECKDNGIEPVAPRKHAQSATPKREGESG